MGSMPLSEPLSQRDASKPDFVLLLCVPPWEPARAQRLQGPQQICHTQAQQAAGVIKLRPLAGRGLPFTSTGTSGVCAIWGDMLSWAHSLGSHPCRYPHLDRSRGPINSDYLNRKPESSPQNHPLRQSQIYCSKGLVAGDREGVWGCQDTTQKNPRSHRPLRTTLWDSVLPEMGRALSKRQGSWAWSLHTASTQ